MSGETGETEYCNIERSLSSLLLYIFISLFLGIILLIICNKLCNKYEDKVKYANAKMLFS